MVIDKIVALLNFMEIFLRLCRVSSNLEFASVAMPLVVFVRCVQNVDPDLGGHVQTVVWTGSDAGLASRAGLPYDADPSVVVSRNE